MQWVHRALTRGARVLCLSDVHGNRAALEAVLADAQPQHADLVVVHGDVVNRGPRSDAVFDRLHQLADARFVFTSGNHERYVRRHATGEAPTGRLADVHATSAFTHRQLGARVRALFGQPDGVSVDVPGLPPLRVVHASLGGDDVGLSPATKNRRDLAPADGVFVVGHLHEALDFGVGDARVVNAGSVGSPSDGVHLAGWVALEATSDGWRVDRGRVPYDVEATDADFRRSGFLDEAGPVAWLIHREWRLAQPVVRPWFDQHLGAVLDGKADLAGSVRAFLDRHPAQPG